METVDLTFKNVASIWWASFWRTLMLGLLVSVMLGAIVGIINGGSGTSDIVIILLGVLASVPIGILALKDALSKTYGGFSIVLIKHPELHSEVDNG